MRKPIPHILCIALAIAGIQSSQAQQRTDTLADGRVKTAPAKPSLSIVNSPDYFQKIRVGSYGEMLYQHMDYSADRYSHPEGALPQNRGAISIPRTILALDYKFNPSWILSVEVEFEYGGTGVARELEYDEGGEYELEVEQGGEVALEQFHITKRFTEAAQIRFGHMIVPVGMINAHHEPINYFGTSRPEGEMTIIPCTWHETGLAFVGSYKGFSYQAMVVSGFDPNGFSSAYWVQQGRQGVFEGAVMTSPALVGRLEYSGVKGLRLGASAYWGNTAKNTSKPGKLDGYKGEVTIFSGDVQYKSKALTARASVVYGNLSDSYKITQVNYSTPKAAGFPRTAVAKNAMSLWAEVGYDILSFWDVKSKLYPFVRYEYYNSMQAVESGVNQNPRYLRDIFSAGINYYPLPNLVVKADYSHRRIDWGNYNSENTFGLSVGYVVWFHSR